ncbi:unnamed protein product [Arabidopsis thaliana]|uniref:(thale cress) hypothetical protein n=1 Tax=Arabidopsis thaliana TaxID=3702 RepID=A0A7G2DQM2_ARATH|nr:unnamed protein product [Arabidopsis thaliana]
MLHRRIPTRHLHPPENLDFTNNIHGHRRCYVISISTGEMGHKTAEGLRDMREMLDHMSWRYVIFYIRLKQAYLSQDLTNAMNILPESRRNDYVQAANELVENMSELDFYVRTPKVYESYLYYEKTLKSIDNVVEFLA